MQKRLRFAVFVVIVLTLLVGSLPAAFATAPSCGVSDTTPAQSQTIDVFGSGWAADRRISIRLTQGGTVYKLGSTHSDSSGDFFTSVTIPGAVSDGSAQLKATGAPMDNPTNKHKCTVNLTIV